jgi:hypothetical protein
MGPGPQKAACRLSRIALLSLACLATLSRAILDNPDPVVPCSVETCFDLERCRDDFSVYVHPTNAFSGAPPGKVARAKPAAGSSGPHADSPQGRALRGPTAAGTLLRHERLPIPTPW